jgi:dTDP-4-amino-4,6-dideoxygalactose transaminase
MRVPFFESPWRSDKVAASRLAEVLASGSYVAGEEVAAFESEFSDWLGGRHVVGVNSGTDALYLALTALGIGPRDEVLLPSFTFIAGLEAIVHTGATPVLVDSMPDGLMPSLEQIETAMTPATRAIVAVPLFGDSAGLPALQAFCRQRDVFLVEDVAQACGASVRNLGDGARLAGTFGEASAFSFYPTKILCGAGDGGAVTFRDAALAERCRTLGNHGMSAGEHVEIGINSRLDSLQAALLRIGLRSLESSVKRRREIAAHYISAMANLPLLRLPTNSPGHAYNYFVLRHPHRDELRRRLSDSGVATRVYYARPIHREPAYLKSLPALNLPTCEKLAAEVFALPLYPTMTSEQIRYVIESVLHACQELTHHA